LKPFVLKTWSLQHLLKTAGQKVRGRRVDLTIANNQDIHNPLKACQNVFMVWSTSADIRGDRKHAP